MVIERNAPRGMVPSDTSDSKLENTGTFTYMVQLKENRSDTRWKGIGIGVVLLLIVGVLVWRLAL